MILRAVAAFLLVLVVIPLGMGKALITGESGRLSFVGGYFASLFIFEILQLVFHVTMGSLRLMTLLWCLICGAIAFFGFWRYRKKGKQTTRNGYLHEPGRVDSIDACSRNDSFANTEYGTEYLLWELG